MPFKSIGKRTGISEYLKGRPAVRQSLYISYRDIEGKPVKTKVKTLDVDEAKLLLAKKKAEIAKKKKAIKQDEDILKRTISLKKLTLDEMAELYFENRTTIENKNNRKNYLNRICPILGKKKVARITFSDVLQLQNTLKSSFAPKTLNETINSLRAMFNEGIENNWCDYNPVDRKKVEKLEEEVVDNRVLSAKELEKYFEVCKRGDYDLSINANPTLYFFSKIAYYSGARPSAVLDLKVKNIGEDFIRFKPMKKGKSYKQTMRVEIMDMVREWITTHELKGDDCLFYPQQSYLKTGDTDIKKKPFLLGNIQRASRKVFEPLFNEDVEVKEDRVTLYTLRRTAGTNRYKAKGLVSAMHFLNHTKIDTTMIYLNVKDDEREQDDDGL